MTSMREYFRAYRAANRERINAYMRHWRKHGPIHARSPAKSAARRARASADQEYANWCREIGIPV